MRTITDRFGRTWELSITIAAADRARAAGYDIFGCFDVFALNEQKPIPKLMWDIANDPTVALRICAAVMNDQCAKRGLTPDTFLEAFDPATALAATAALREELADFFRQAGRKHLATVLLACGKLADALPNGTIEEYGSSPESSESTPAH